MTFLLLFSSFVYYLYGLSGTVPAYRDSGDLIASIHTLGIAHPPGYALYVLLGKLFITLIPFGNVAYRVNVMSAFFAAASACALYRVLRRSAAADAAGPLAVTLLFATSPAVTALARVAEMYTLSAFLSALLLFFLLSDEAALFPWAALVLGLGLSVHPTLVFLVPLFLINPKQTLTRRTGLYFLLGLSVFLYLPIRAAQHPLLNWGDPSHWRSFWRVVTRADYGGLKLHPEQSVLAWSPVTVWIQLNYFMKTFVGEWGWAALLVGALGAFRSIREARSRAKNTALFAAWLLSGPAFFVLSNLPLTEATTPAILQPYLLLPGLLWAPFVVQGFGVLLSRASRFYWVPALAGFLLVVLRPWGWTSERNDFYAYDYARNLLRSLPAHAVLYNPDDPTTFTIQVLQTVEKRRPDVILLSFFRTRWGYERIKRLWPELLPPIPIENGQELQRMLWTYSALNFPFYAELPQKFGQIPYRSEGLVYAAQVLPHRGADSSSRRQAEAGLDVCVRRGDFVTTHHADFFTRHIISYYAAAENNLGIEYANSGDWPKALEHYARALAIEPDQQAAQTNSAIALQKMPKRL